MTTKPQIEAVTPPQVLQTRTPETPGPSQDPVSSQEVASSVAQLPPGTDPVVKGWLDKINQAGGGRIGWVIQIGECLTKAKDELGHGRWGLLFGPGGLKFGQRRAEMFMEIVRCPTLCQQRAENAVILAV
jgi:hypothetical protein